jgi:hypothetical protein
MLLLRWMESASDPKGHQHILVCALAWVTKDLELSKEIVWTNALLWQTQSTPVHHRELDDQARPWRWPFHCRVDFGLFALYLHYCSKSSRRDGGETLPEGLHEPFDRSIRQCQNALSCSPARYWVVSNGLKRKSPCRSFSLVTVRVDCRNLLAREIVCQDTKIQ